MKKSYELKYHILEDTHWWFRGRRDIIFRLIEKADKNSKILEVGCSGGPLLKYLIDKGFNNVYGIDISKKAIVYCKKRRLNNVFAIDGTKTKFKDNYFDIIISSDLLEHIKNDYKALSEWNRILKQGGKLIIFVPAFSFLWSKHDEANYHHKRYSKLELIKLIKNANFQIEKSSYWNFILFFLSSILKIIQRIKNKKSDHLFEVNPILNNILILILKLENQIIKKFNLPFGISVFVIVKKIK